MGLPGKGRCPECGELYDKHSIYRSVRRREPAFMKHIKWVTLAVFTLLVLVCGGALSIQAPNPWGAVAITVIVAGVSGFGAFAYWWAEREERRASE